MTSKIENVNYIIVRQAAIDECITEQDFITNIPGFDTNYLNKIRNACNLTSLAKLSVTDLKEII